MKDGKRKEEMKKWKRMERRSQNCKLSNGIKFCLVASSLEQLSS